jgi:hypothetical protein
MELVLSRTPCINYYSILMKRHCYLQDFVVINLSTYTTSSINLHLMCENSCSFLIILVLLWNFWKQSIECYSIGIFPSTVHSEKINSMLHHSLLMYSETIWQEDLYVLYTLCFVFEMMGDMSVYLLHSSAVGCSLDWCINVKRWKYTNVLKPGPLPCKSL